MGIFVAYTCDACEERIRARYNPAIFDGTAYPAEEPIEPEWPTHEEDVER